MIKAKYKILHIYDEIFKWNYWISYGVPKKYIQKQAEREAPELRGEFEILYAGKCVNNFDKRLSWIWTEEKKITILVHEIVHAALYCLGHKMNINSETEETVAYTIEMITRKTLEKQRGIK